MRSRLVNQAAPVDNQGGYVVNQGPPAIRLPRYPTQIETELRAQLADVYAGHPETAAFAVRGKLQVLLRTAPACLFCCCKWTSLTHRSP
jgi:hypothetical protein